ncbi:hypothetical protein HBI83_099630 [Parastagonospora nodorum]|nr:hypothetical protein HBI83_099630 [Parastagonospora nodorum]
MKTLTLLTAVVATLTTAQTPAPYTDPKSGITFSTFQHTSGMFFGLTLPLNSTSNTSFIATIGGKGTSYSGVSLGGGMLNKLLLIAWPNGQSIVSSFRKTATYASPTVATGTFSQRAIANGTYVNSTHWTYTFLCERCIQSDGTTFRATDGKPSIGFVLNPSAPAKKGDQAASVSRHTEQGQVVFDLGRAKREGFEVWRGGAEIGNA